MAFSPISQMEKQTRMRIKRFSLIKDYRFAFGALVSFLSNDFLEVSSGLTSSLPSQVSDHITFCEIWTKGRLIS